MGCVSSNLLNQSDDFSHLTTSSITHHCVKLTSTSYGLLNLDPIPSQSPSDSSAVTAPATPMTPPQRFTIGKESNSLFSDSKIINSEPDVINFWELMSGLETDTCRFSPLLKTPVKFNLSNGLNKENSNPNFKNPKNSLNDDVPKPQDPKIAEAFETLCPPGGENRVVIYTTSLRGVRRTFEACNAVRAAIESFGVVLCERDISMDKGFREELMNLMEKSRNRNQEAKPLPPRVFIKGKYIGGVEEVMRLVEEGEIGDLLRGVARKKDFGGGGGGACDVCGGVSFLPCSGCNGSCKVVEGWGSDAVVVRCMDCNENGLVRCPICS